MATDKRELILLRMVAILQGINSGAVPFHVYRNRGELPEEKLPALVLLDGHEDLKNPGMPHTRGGARVPTVYDLKPQVFIVLKPRDTIENSGIGEELSGVRMQLLQGFINDDELNVLLGSNGEINYLGHLSDLENGMALNGQMQLNFVLSYVFDPRDLN